MARVTVLHSRPRRLPNLLYSITSLEDGKAAGCGARLTLFVALGVSLRVQQRRLAVQRRYQHFGGRCFLIPQGSTTRRVEGRRPPLPRCYPGLIPIWPTAECSFPEKFRLSAEDGGSQFLSNVSAYALHL